ncbi:uspA domain-containing protein [Pseudomonas citronellolis]|uniref:universal stress protein n=1 Tax=Pseudomonas citronellolis TaxID=53408 RepID=UPI000E2FAFCD|nr:universal stress protein [Pseudomonas citronellolis]GBL55083.1 uspA domain-containing protein [Pseudomonas citronellolis]
MNAYSRLLLICDTHQHYSAAMARAQALAGSAGASLHMLMIDSLAPALNTLDYDLQQRARNTIQERHQAWLDDQVELLRGRGIEASAEAVWSDDPLQEVLRRVRERGFDLLIKDVHYETAVSRALMTPLDWQLLRQCAVPLHLVSHAEHPLPRKVVAALDLSQDDTRVDELNERIVESAQQLARQCDAELHLLQAYDLSSSFLAYAVGPVAWTSEVQEQMSGRATERMQRLGERFGIEQKCLHLIKGAANRVIAEFVDDYRMDVVVMGTLYHAGLAKIVGSTTEQALYRVHSSILAIRP